MKQRIFFHIGAPKTATTFLQDKVFANSDSILYVGRPFTQQNTEFNKLQYADESLYDHEALLQLFCELRKKANGRPIVISDEFFFGYPYWNFSNRTLICQRLNSLAPEAEAILFLRGQVQLLLSLHNQFVKSGMFCRELDQTFLHPHAAGMSLHDWELGNREWNQEDRYINERSLFTPSHFLYSKILDTYSGIFPKVHTFLYEELKCNPTLSMQKLEATIGVALFRPKPNTTERVNSAITPDEIPAKILQNRLSNLWTRLRGNRGKRLAKIGAKFLPRLTPIERETFLREALREVETSKDNRIANETHRLNMQEYTDAYFDI